MTREEEKIDLSWGRISNEREKASATRDATGEKKRETLMMVVICFSDDQDW